MDVFDSNIWALGITETDPAAAELVAEVRDMPRSVAVSAYIFCEVLDALASAEYVEPHEVEQTQTNFGAFVHRAAVVEGPTQDEIEACDVAHIRNENWAGLIGALADIQPKDAPVLALADGIRQNARRPDTVTIYTADEPFASFDPDAAGLDRLQMEYVGAASRTE